MWRLFMTHVSCIRVVLMAAESYTREKIPLFYTSRTSTTVVISLTLQSAGARHQKRNTIPVIFAQVISLI